jgi:hypothetical protein
MPNLAGREAQELRPRAIRVALVLCEFGCEDEGGEESAVGAEERGGQQGERRERWAWWLGLPSGILRPLQRCLGALLLCLMLLLLWW